MNCGNIYWSGEFVYKTDGGLVWTAETSAGVMELSIKVLQNQLRLLEHHLELWNPLYKVLENQVELLEHQLELWNCL